MVWLWSDVMVPHQHIGLTCSLEYSGVRHSLCHDVSPDPVNLQTLVVNETGIFLFTLLNFLPSTGICFMMSSLLKIGWRYSQDSWQRNQASRMSCWRKIDASWPVDLIEFDTYLHWDQLVLPLLHLLLEGLNVRRAVHCLRLQDVVVQHHLDNDVHNVIISIEFCGRPECHRLHWELTPLTPCMAHTQISPAQYCYWFW